MLNSIYCYFLAISSILYFVAAIVTAWHQNWTAFIILAVANVFQILFILTKD